MLGGSGAAAIGASAFFVVIAGQTLGTLLRDITAGATMIIERWFHVGDYIKIEPFWDVKGVVERFTLRSTRIRSLSGEIIIVHNQKIDAVHVTPNGVRTMAVEIFVKDKQKGEALVHHITIFAGITSCLVLCLAYTYPVFLKFPAISLIALTVFYSMIDEGLHWHRYLTGHSDRVEMWSHFFIFLGHTIMILSWYFWYSEGYPGVSATLPYIF
jgi:hypothetical protein